MSSTLAIIIPIAAVIGMVAILILDGHGSLNIKSRTAGDGQYGRARWSTPREIQETFQMVPFEPMKWRAGKNLPKQEGTVLGFQGHAGHTAAMGPLVHIGQPHGRYQPS